MDRGLQVELLDEFREVGAVRVHVVAGPRLARTSMTSAVVGDATVAVLRQKEHLVLKGVGRKWPTMAENYGLSLAPILIINLRSIFCGNCVHVSFFFFVFGFCLRCRRIRRRGFSGQGGHGKSGNGPNFGGVDPKSSTRDVDVSAGFFSYSYVRPGDFPFSLGWRLQICRLWQDKTWPNSFRAGVAVI